MKEKGQKTTLQEINEKILRNEIYKSLSGDGFLVVAAMVAVGIAHKNSIEALCGEALPLAFFGFCYLRCRSKESDLEEAKMSELDRLFPPKHFRSK